MSQRNYEERTRREKPAPEQEEYDLYLFWPSLSNRDLSSGDSPSSPLYGPVSLDSESSDYDTSALDSAPPSPIMFAPVLDRRYRYPLPVEEALDSGTPPPPPPEEPNAGAQVREENVPVKYSPIFKMGLFFFADGPRF